MGKERKVYCQIWQYTKESYIEKERGKARNRYLFGAVGEREGGNGRGRVM